MASDKGFLRTSLSSNVLNSVDLAVKNAILLGLDEIRIFEIGKVFDKTGEHTSLFAVIKNIKKKLEKEKEKIKTVRDEQRRFHALRCDGCTCTQSLHEPPVRCAARNPLRQAQPQSL
jgi:hypothetical protein